MLLACREASPAGLEQKELAAILAVSASQVSGLVEQLRRRGLLQGSRAANDRRRQLWQLTPTGRVRLQDILSDLADWTDPLDGELGADPSEALRRLLGKLAEVLADRSGSDRSAATSAGPLDGPSPCGRVSPLDTRRKGAA